MSVVVGVLFAAGCTADASGGASEATTSAVPSASTTSASTSITSTTTRPSTTTTTPVWTGDLEDPDVRRVLVDDRELVVAWADSPDERSVGLMGVRDMGDLAGMVFDLGEERAPTFTMRNTLIPLDIAFFDETGAGLGVVEMVPCESEPCPTYGIDDPARYALEVPAETLDLSADSRLEIP